MDPCTHGDHSAITSGTNSNQKFAQTKNEHTTSVDNEAPWGPHLRSASLVRGLRSRHIQMSSICGMIGTGLFLASGSALADAGPLGALESYSVMGLVTAAIAYTSGEMSAFMPVSGGFVHHVTTFVEKDLGAAVGWNFWYSIGITQAVELVGASSLVSFWAPNINPAAWIGIFWVATLCANMGPVRYYGEVEFSFALIKIALILGLLLMGILIDTGAVGDHGAIGFRYWHRPGAFQQLPYVSNGIPSHIPGAFGRFLAFWSTLTNAAFAYGNVQVVGISGAETVNPRRAIPKAVSRTFIRVVFFYVAAIFILGLIVSSDDPALSAGGGTAARSPFVIAIKRAGIQALPGIVNAVVMTSALSSGISCVFLSSRTLVGLANDGHAPRFFLITNSFGTPWIAVLFTWSLGGFAFLSAQYTALKVLIWLVNLAAVAGLVCWVILCLAYIRMYAGIKAQGYSRSKLPYKSWPQPFLAWFGLVSCTVIVFFSGFQVFLKGNFTASGFLSNYINVFVFTGLYLLIKLYTRSWQIFIPADKIDLSEFHLLEVERAEAAVRHDDIMRGDQKPEPEGKADRPTPDNPRNHLRILEWLSGLGRLV
ncbi:amino acid transporter [Cantharellus anzutake]|uniref:amino acid transporter n=1 Tax=Cantharellus anzutake TaxID=1750568 RepID=UPI001903CB44|nr:amino acid transporter [Cantharellus anzutake]KAF8339069.1 amino acid transporter [Cantharellus anzutake]